MPLRLPGNKKTDDMVATSDNNNDDNEKKKKKKASQVARSLGSSFFSPVIQSDSDVGGRRGRGKRGSVRGIQLAGCCCCLSPPPYYCSPAVLLLLPSPLLLLPPSLLPAHCPPRSRAHTRDFSSLRYTTTTPSSPRRRMNHTCCTLQAPRYRSENFLHTHTVHADFWRRRHTAERKYTAVGREKTYVYRRTMGARRG